MFLRFWLSKITRIIHHNQLPLTKFARLLPYWTDDVKSAAQLHIIKQLTEKNCGRVWVAFEVSIGEVSNGRRFYSFHGELLSKNMATTARRQLEGRHLPFGVFERLFYVSLNLMADLTLCLNCDFFVPQLLQARFRYRDFVTRFVLWASLPRILSRPKSTWTSTWHNLLQSNLYIAVTLYITVTG